MDEEQLQNGDNIHNVPTVANMQWVNNRNSDSTVRVIHQKTFIPTAMPVDYDVRIDLSLGLGWYPWSTSTEAWVAVR
jgi:hypothetical protein